MNERYKESIYGVIGLKQYQEVCLVLKEVTDQGTYYV